MEDTFNAFIDPELCIQPQGNGILNGTHFAVKDVFAVKGHRNAAGNPDWFKSHAAADQHAASIDLLLKAGACLTGITHTDELMYSLNGENYHYGTPVNPRSKDCIPGGSSSGSAAAAAAGCVDFAIGTDTGGSVRIPSSYCGIFGFRPSHGATNMDGVIPLAPAFDTIGWMARDARVLYKAGQVLLQQKTDPGAAFKQCYYAEDAWELAEEVTKNTLISKMAELKPASLPVLKSRIADELLGTWSAAFRLLQGRQIWETHGDWIKNTHPKFGPDIHDRFEWASAIPKDGEWDKANQLRVKIRNRLRDMLGSTGLIVIPTTPGPAPAIGRPLQEVEKTRTSTMQLSCIAGLAGLPQLTIPFTTDDGKPLGLSLIAGYGQDLKLLAWTKELLIHAANDEPASKK
ncbi:amidase [Heyndrickxia acidiproducens]|uniref:amidase n=1 Tax=Heyndrickxia acidiproducens TaxID=1121084 RepID=UPI000378F20A|nr:amidase [Heyndrickxia acidiproducens]